MRESSSLLPPEPWPQRISRILAWIGGAIILVGCSGLITIDVITRYLFKRGMVESFEISGYALAACIGLGLGFVKGMFGKLMEKIGVQAESIDFSEPPTADTPLTIVAEMVNNIKDFFS